MKVTKSQLKQIIKEEIKAVLNESQFDGDWGGDPREYTPPSEEEMKNFKERQRQEIEDLKAKVIADPSLCREASRKAKEGSQYWKNVQEACAQTRRMGG